VQELWKKQNFCMFLPFRYLLASSGRSVLECSTAGIATGQSPFQASGDFTFRYLMRTGIAASRSDS
jgi:hypothetical protein